MGLRDALTRLLRPARPELPPDPFGPPATNEAADRPAPYVPTPVPPQPFGL